MTLVGSRLTLAELAEPLHPALNKRSLGSVVVSGPSPPSASRSPSPEVVELSGPVPFCDVLGPASAAVTWEPLPGPLPGHQDPVYSLELQQVRADPHPEDSLLRLAVRQDSLPSLRRSWMEARAPIPSHTFTYSKGVAVPARWDGPAPA
jgi:hypothetical protein